MAHKEVIWMRRSITGFASILVLSCCASRDASAQGCLTGSPAIPGFQTSLLDKETGQFTFEVDATPKADQNGVDAGVTLATGRLAQFNDMAATLRFSRTSVDMRDGSSYRADRTIGFTPGLTYHIRMVVDLGNHQYSAYIRPSNVATETTVGENYAFRTEQANVSSLNIWGAFADIGFITACNGVAYSSYQPARLIQLDGVKDFIEIPDHDAFSVNTTGELTVSAWVRPDTLSFSKIEGSGYVDFLGKGEGNGTTGQQEWCFRIYSQGNSENRQNRISFYVFNADGHLGNGSYVQDPVTVGQWIHLVAVVNSRSTYLYKNGVLRDCDNYRPNGPSTCNPPFVTVTPTNGTAPLRIGTTDLSSFFQGSIKDVRVWNRALTTGEVSAVYNGSVPSNGLVAEYALYGDVVPGGSGPNGLAFGARWLP